MFDILYNHLWWTAPISGRFCCRLVGSFNFRPNEVNLIKESLCLLRSLLNHRNYIIPDKSRSYFYAFNCILNWILFPSLGFAMVILLKKCSHFQREEVVYLLLKTDLSFCSHCSSTISEHCTHFHCIPFAMILRSPTFSSYSSFFFLPGFD